MYKNPVFSKIIAVDLDGTLTYTDTLHESILALLRLKPFYIFLIPFWITHGRPGFKEIISNHINLDPSNLPYNWELIEWLKHEKKKGKIIVLSTAANKNIAYSVANYLKIFDEVISSDKVNNLKGLNKSNALVKRFGFKQFDYAGNSRADFPVWTSAKNAILVNTTKTIEKEVRKISNVSKVFTPKSLNPSTVLEASKLNKCIALANIFLCIAFLFYEKIINNLFIFLFSFLSLCFCTAICYIIQDLMYLRYSKKNYISPNLPNTNYFYYIELYAFFLFVYFLFKFIFSIIIGIKFAFLLFAYFLLISFYIFINKNFTRIRCTLLVSSYLLALFSTSAAVKFDFSLLQLIFFIIFSFFLSIIRPENMKR